MVDLQGLTWEYITWNIDLERLAWLTYQWTLRPRVTVSLYRIIRLMENWFGIESEENKPPEVEGDPEGEVQKVDSKTFKEMRRKFKLPDQFDGDTPLDDYYPVEPGTVSKEEYKARRAAMGITDNLGASDE